MSQLDSLACWEQLLSLDASLTLIPSTILDRNPIVQISTSQSIVLFWRSSPSSYGWKRYAQKTVVVNVEDYGPFMFKIQVSHIFAPPYLSHVLFLYPILFSIQSTVFDHLFIPSSFFLPHSHHSLPSLLYLLFSKPSLPPLLSPIFSLINHHPFSHTFFSSIFFSIPSSSPSNSLLHPFLSFLNSHSPLRSPISSQEMYRDSLRMRGICVSAAQFDAVACGLVLEQKISELAQKLGLWIINDDLHLTVICCARETCWAAMYCAPSVFSISTFYPTPLLFIPT